MRKKYKLWTIGLAVFVTLLGYGVAKNPAMSEEAKNHAEDQAAIKQAAAAYSAAFEKGDVDTLLSYWSPDAEYIDESGKLTQGSAAIGAMIRKNQESLKGCKLKLEGKGLRFVTPDVALVDGNATLASPDGHEDVTPFAAVWVKSAGKWRVRSLRDLGEDDVMQRATSADHLKQFEPLIGDWVSADKGKSVQLRCRWKLNKSFLLAEYTVKVGSQESTTEQQLGWDPVNQQVRSWYFDSTGGFGEATCTQVGDTWVSEAIGVLPDGRIGTATNVLRMIDDKSFVFSARNRAVDGRPLADTETRFVRNGAKE
jgi:uncharacterized protein (TIGR02246 family)